MTFGNLVRDKKLTFSHGVFCYNLNPYNVYCLTCLWGIDLFESQFSKFVQLLTSKCTDTDPVHILIVYLTIDHNNSIKIQTIFINRIYKKDVKNFKNSSSIQLCMTTKKVWLPDRHMDRRTDKVITMCRYASQATTSDLERDLNYLMTL